MVYYFPNIKDNKLIVLLAIAIMFSILSIVPFPWNEPLKNAFIDLQFKIRGNRQLSDNITIVFIGDEDIKALNAQNVWPITRDYYGYMVYVLSQLEAKVIGIDVSFDVADRNYPEYDNALAEILSVSRSVCLPIAFSELTFSQKNTNEFSSTMQTGYGATFPISKFRNHVSGLGFSNFNLERIIRKVPIVVAYDDSFMLSFGCELARIFLNRTKSISIDLKTLAMIDSSGKKYLFPIDQQGRLRLNHFGDIHNLHAIGFVDLLQTFEMKPDTLDFKDKIAIIAVTASSVTKLRATPLSSGLPSTLIHATVAENLIYQNFLREIPTFLHLFIIVFLVFSVWLIFRFKKNITIVASGIGFLLAYWIIAMIIFKIGNTILPLFYPTLAFFVTSTYTGIMRSLKHRQQEDTIKTLLNEQIKTKGTQLKEAKAKLAEIQTQLQQEVTISEQSRKLAEERQLAILKLEKELRDLQSYVVPQKAEPKIQFPEIIHAESSKMAQLLELVATISSDDIPVLIMGETGTGKEMIARAIHNSSKRKHAPFVAINCGALSETLLESELFGHEKGSFTGAHSRRRGRFELADGGTIFLDEITETSPAFQTRLLRVLQEASFERIGGEQTIKVDVRIIAATNKDVQVEMEHNRFRADLFYRLNGFPITIPPLRERQDDIPLLALHFLKKYNYTSITTFSDRAMEILKGYSWQGNVRELENIIRRAAILAQSEKRNIIRESNLPEEILTSKPNQTIQMDYKPLEDQILEMLRSFQFSRSAISQTAKALGNRDRGTITEYFRGICFENLVNSDFNVESAAQSIANSTDSEIIDRVKTKINEYLNKLQLSVHLNLDELNPDDLPSAFKGLPKNYHSYLQKVIENLDRFLPQK